MPTPSRRSRADPGAAAGLVQLGRDVLRVLRGHDVALYAAGVTFYAAIGLVPMLLLALWLAGLVAGEESVAAMARELASHLPTNLGAERAATGLADTGSRLGPGPALAALVPATLYGEGLVRAFDRLSVRGDEGRRSLRGRLGSLVIVAFSPVLLLAGLSITNWLSGALGDGLGPRLLGIYLAFLVGWVSLSVLLMFAYRGLAPQRPGLRALLWGALGTASVLSGFSLGWVLFLGIRLPLARAFGGSVPLAALAVSLFWLWLLHLIVLLGYVVTLQLAARRGHPRGPVLEEETVRPMVQPAA